MMITNKNIDGGKGFDWGLASADYAKYRDIYPEEFYKRIVDLGYCKDGQRVLDLGTGTGVLPRNMYKYGAKFVGTDISDNQIKYAKKLSKGLDIDYIVSSAEKLEFPENSFDVVTACQCFMYFDKKIILPKIHRFLKDGGHFLLLFMAWLPFESEIAKASEDLVLKYSPEWSGKGMTRYKLEEPEWASPLFTVDNAVAFDLDIPFTRESWNGRMKACRGVDASLSSSEIAEFEKEHLAYLKTVPETFTIPHYATILDLKKRS
ncbi:MAG: class I SAM-dependent methyltransferase [Eubacterium sp.]|nr:class I SAM-dependent methyltransferase [Eubacterium sp.]